MASPKLILQRIGILGNRYEETVDITNNSTLVFDKDGTAVPSPMGVFWGTYATPNGNVMSTGPAVYYGTADGTLWFKTDTTTANTGWTKVVG